jgi:hypothetical protein
MNELTLKFEEKIPQGIVTDILIRALNLYEFFNEHKWQGEDCQEEKDFDLVMASLYDIALNDDLYVERETLNSSLKLKEPIYHDPNNNDEDFMNWLIEKGHIKFNDDGSVDLPEPSEEFKKQREDSKKKYEKTKELFFNLIDENFDDEQKHWIGIREVADEVEAL